MFEADVNIINEDTWVRLGKPRVQPVLSKLTSPGGDTETIGKLEIAVQDREVEMFVIKCKSHQSNLLSRSTASEMGLVKFINNIKEYPKVICEPVKIKSKKMPDHTLLQSPEECRSLSCKKLKQS